MATPIAITATTQSHCQSGGGSGGSGNTASGRFSSVSGGQNITQETDFGWSAGSEAEDVVVGNVRSP